MTSSLLIVVLLFVLPIVAQEVRLEDYVPPFFYNLDHDMAPGRMDVKHNAAVFVGSKLKCSGVAVNNSSVVLSADCVSYCQFNLFSFFHYTYVIPTEEIKVVIGKTSVAAELSPDMDAHDVLSVKFDTYDPCWNLTGFKLALLTFAPKGGVQNLTSLELDGSHDLDDVLVVVGWSIETKAKNYTLRRNTALVIPERSCERRKVHDGVCMRYGNESVTCSGDLGSPVYMQKSDKLLGIITSIKNPVDKCHFFDTYLSATSAERIVELLKK